MAGPLSYDAVINDAGWTNTLTSMERRVLGLTNTVTKQTNVIDREFARLGQLAAGYFSFQALAQLPGQILKVRGEFQSLALQKKHSSVIVLWNRGLHQRNYNTKISLNIYLK